MPKDIIGARARIGTNPQLAILNLTALVEVMHDDAANPANIMLGQFTADINSPTTMNYKGRGTLAAPADVAINDRLFDFQAFEYSGGTFFNGVNIRAYVDAAVVSGQAPATRIVFETCAGNAAATEEMAIFSNGFVAIGTDNIARGVSGSLGHLHIAANSTASAYIERASSDTTSPLFVFRKTRGTLAAATNVVAGDETGRIDTQVLSNTYFTNVEIVTYVDGAVTAGQMPGGGLVIKTAPANGALTDRFRVYSGGLVHIGPGTPDTTAGRSLHVQSATAGIAGTIVENTAGGATAHGLKVRAGDNSTTGSDFISFFRQDNTKIGDVDQNSATTVAYNTSSDVRLKENIADTVKGLAEVLRIKTRDFNYKADPDHRMTGFIAQELHAVYPEAVSVGGGSVCDCMNIGKKRKDTVLWDGIHRDDCAHAEPWGVDYGKLTPLLVRAVQELHALIQAGK